MKLSILALSTALLFSAAALAQNTAPAEAPNTSNPTAQTTNPNYPNRANHPNATANQNNGAMPENAEPNPAGPNNTGPNGARHPMPMNYNYGHSSGGWGLWGLLGLFGFFGLARGGGRREEVVRTTNLPPR